MSLPFDLDPDRLRQQLERACRQALHDWRSFPTEETRQRAAGRLDGILQGLNALVRALGGGSEADELFDLARQVVEPAREELRRAATDG